MKVLLASSPTKSFCFVKTENGNYDGTVEYTDGEQQPILNLKEKDLFDMVMNACCNWIEVQAI